MLRPKGIVVLAILAVAVFSGTSTRCWAYTTGGGIVNTPHDFSTAYRTKVGLCTFCHTPHKAISTQLLWNHTLSSNATFHWESGAMTEAGTPYPTFPKTYAGPTAKCLSCHDGSVAIGDIAWFKGAKPAPITGVTVSGAYNVGVSGIMSGNHPVAMPYPYLRTGSTYNLSTTGSALIPTEWVSDPTASGIRLFNDDGKGNISAGAVSAKTGIECTSCHDVHNGASTQDWPLLRGMLTGTDSTYLCNKCHLKY